MRRVPVRALRTTFQCTVRGLARTSRLRRTVFSHHSSHLNASLGVRSAASSSAATSAASTSPSYTRPNYAVSEPLRSSMYIRRFSFAIVSSLVGYGAWYTYKGGNTLEQVGAKSYATAPTQLTNSAATTRNVLVVGADELHTGTFVGEGPIAKNVDGSGRNVLEMLTPDQATEKLRQNEASFLVNRGQGVLRYDVVQVASNNPIEDDHAEKIVEVASRQGENTDNKPIDDWMFWGVFDGHAYVLPTLESCNNIQNTNLQ